MSARGLQGLEASVAVASAKVLIIEDDPDIARLLGLRLRNDGYRTALAADAVTALTVARKEEPDVIVLDLGLPGGDGMLVIERLKSVSALAHVPVIVVSARDPASSGPLVLEAGATAFVAKPIEMDRFLLAVRSALGQPLV